MKIKIPPINELRRMKIADLIPHEKNPRKITPAAMERLKKSLHELGNLSPVTFNLTTKKVLGGHQRLKALVQLGETETDVWCVNLDARQETMNGKPVYFVPAKSIINFHAAFDHKLLCDGLTFTTGSACAYGCEFCYTGAMMVKNPHWQSVLKKDPSAKFEGV